MASQQSQEEQEEEQQPRPRKLSYKRCNYCVNYSTLTAPHQVMIEILKGHPLSYALSATTTVPEVYIKELWKSLKHKTTTKREMFEGRIDNIKVQITQDFLRNVLRLPQKKDRKGMADFEMVPKNGVIIQDLRKLGFDESVNEFTSSTGFLKKNLAALWSTLFMPINRCLTPKKKCQDKCCMNVLRIFHGVVYDKHYDFSVMIWKQFVTFVKGKSKYDYVPYLRFVKLIIAEFMTKDPSITTRPHDGCPTDKIMKSMTKTSGNTVVKAMRIPEALLSYADPESSAVADYRSASKKRKHPSTTIASNRVTKKRKDPSSANTPLSVDNIERDSSSPLERAHTPPSHLSSSRKDLISHTPRENPHKLSSTLPNMIDHGSEDICPHFSLPPPHSQDNHTDHMDYTDNHMDHTDHTEDPFFGVSSGISIPGIATTPMLSLPSSSNTDDTPAATRGSAKSCIQELTNRVLLLESQNCKLEQQKNKAEAEVALLTAQPSNPNVTQLVELLVTSLKPELSHLLSSHDFNRLIPSELKELPSKINELTGEINELPWGDLKEIPNKLETLTSTLSSLTSEVAQLNTLPSEFLVLPGQVASVQTKLKPLDALPSLLNKFTNTLNRFAHIMENASQKAAHGEKNTNQVTISQLFQRRIAKDAERTNLNPQPTTTAPTTTTITPPATSSIKSPFFGVLSGTSIPSIATTRVSRDEIDQKLTQMGGQELCAHIVSLMRRKFNAKKV